MMAIMVVATEGGQENDCTHMDHVGVIDANIRKVSFGHDDCQLITRNIKVDC